MQSDNSTDRELAFGTLAGEHGAMSAKELPRAVEDALIELLKHECGITRFAFLEGTGASGKYGEDYSEYIAWLGSAVKNIAERTDIWPVLLSHGYSPESAFTRWVASLRQ